MRRYARFLLCFPLGIFSTGLRAQDTRNVTEPKVPPVCAVLRADLVTADNLNGLSAADEQRPDTGRVQASLDRCPEGSALELTVSGLQNAFLIGPIELRRGRTLLVDDKVTLFGSRKTEDYERAPGSCGALTLTPTEGCKALISGNDAAGSAVMGKGIIDGRGGSNVIVHGVEGQSWWQMAQQAGNGLYKHSPRMISINGTDNFILYRITLRNSPGFHIAYSLGEGLTVWGVILDTPSSARNTDGIDPYGAKNVTIAYSYIRVGDDNVAIKTDKGHGSSNITIIHNHFYGGHGMSIGSGTDPEVTGVRVTDLSLDGTQLAGLRIKSGVSNGGHVHDVIYDDICIRNSDRPIQLETSYADNPGSATTRFPLFNDITFKNIRITGGGKLIFNGLDDAHRLGATFEGVQLVGDRSNYKISSRYADFFIGALGANFEPVGANTTSRGHMSPIELASCADKFVPFPSGH